MEQQRAHSYWRITPCSGQASEHAGHSDNFWQGLMRKAKRRVLHLATTAFVRNG
jgi:hypothetical protein